MPLVAAIALIVTAVLFVVGIITLIVGFATHRVSMESPLADDDDNDDLSDDTATLLSMLPGASVVVDEHDEVVESIHKVGEDAYQVLGTADLEDLFEFLCIRDEETESSTVSGWVMERLGRVPRSGESFRYEGWLLTAAKADPRRVCEVEVRRLPAEQTLAV